MNNDTIRDGLTKQAEALADSAIRFGDRIQLEAAHLVYSAAGKLGYGTPAERAKWHAGVNVSYWKENGGVFGLFVKTPTVGEVSHADDFGSWDDNFVVGWGPANMALDAQMRLSSMWDAEDAFGHGQFYVYQHQGVWYMRRQSVSGANRWTAKILGRYVEADGKTIFKLEMIENVPGLPETAAPTDWRYDCDEEIPEIVTRAAHQWACVGGEWVPLANVIDQIAVYVEPETVLAIESADTLTYLRDLNFDDDDE